MARSTHLPKTGEKPPPDEKSNEWHTPPEFIEAARRLFGGTIELDPASSFEANQRVKAERFYSTANCGLNPDNSWQCRSLWMNPPFAGGEKWLNRLRREYMAGNVKEAVLLFKYVQNYDYYQPFLHLPTIIKKGRTSFLKPNGEAGESSFDGSIVFVYFGNRPANFFAEFIQFGSVLTLSDNPAVICPACRQTMPVKQWGGQNKKYCSNACRQKAYRERL